MHNNALQIASEGLRLEFAILDAVTDCYSSLPPLGLPQKLDLSGCSGIADTTLQAVVQHCRGLQYLDVSSCTKLTNSMFVTLGKVGAVACCLIVW